jgi:hypothetical protein
VDCKVGRAQASVTALMRAAWLSLALAIVVLCASSTGASRSPACDPFWTAGESVSVDKHPLRVGLVVLSAALALAAMLLTGCGGSDDRTKVEASLRHYISTLAPGDVAFTIGSGPPRLQNKSCKDRHVTIKRGQVHSFHNDTVIFPETLALWSCVVTFRTGLTLPVDVAVKGSEVVHVFPGASPDAPKQPPATVYKGGP